jgi:hypothetical protein
VGLDHPDGTNEYERKGWFVSLAGSYADPTDAGLDNSLGVGGDIGYRCHRYFSTAVKVEQLLEFEGFSEDDADPLAVTTNFKAHLPLGRFQPFALAGGGMMAAYDDSKAIVLRFGAGLDFYVTKHFVLSVGADYLIPFGDLDYLEYISVGWGAQYRF